MPSFTAPLQTSFQPSKTPSIKPRELNEDKSHYRRHLVNRLPMLTTRLVREADFSFAEREQLTTPEGVAALLQEYFADKDREEFIVVLMDVACTATGIVRISMGGLTGTTVEARQVFKAALLGNADSIIAAHNHPSGNPEPSKEDCAFTRQLQRAGELIDINLLDHLIITGSGYTSLAERGEIK